jgi:hypothetical protein
VQHDSTLIDVLSEGDADVLSYLQDLQASMLKNGATSARSQTPFYKARWALGSDYAFPHPRSLILDSESMVPLDGGFKLMSHAEPKAPNPTP